MSFGPMRVPGSGIFHGIRELRAGHCATFTREQVRIRQYWSLQSAPHTDNAEQTAEHIRALLEDTVRRQLIADVPVATLLSGGLDSSGVTALAALDFKREGKTLDTYSIEYVDLAQFFEESAVRPDIDTPWIKRVSAYTGTNHHPITVDSPELVESLLVPMRAFDLPGMGQISTSLYLLFKEIKKQATVALSGESADEVFGGYPWFHDETVLNTPTFPWRISGRNMLASTGRGLLSPALYDSVHIQEFITEQYEAALAEVPRLAGEDARAARQREIFYLNQTRFLPMLLDRKDRISMATGLEVRVPFCDYRLVQYVWNIPWQIKSIDGREKGILRHALSHVLPDDVIQRKKSAYPTSHNPSYLNAVSEWALRILDNPNSPVRNLVNTKAVRTLAEGKGTELPREARMATMDFVIQLNTWLDEYHVTLI
jgi:asparagine synthase (glutamine-hydrolysing)